MTGRDLLRLRPAFAAAAQKVYDEWDENEDEYAGGGICHLIADAFCDVLYSHGVDATTQSASIGEVHVWAVAKADDGVWMIDISPYTYETGGGYSWQKIHGVVFMSDDVNVEMVSPDPDDFEQYGLDGLSGGTSKRRHRRRYRRARHALKVWVERPRARRGAYADYTVFAKHPRAETWDKEIGRLSVDVYERDGVLYASPGYAGVYGTWQRLGVATAMYLRAAQEARRLGATFRSGWPQSYAAAMLWHYFVARGWARYDKLDGRFVWIAR